MKKYISRVKANKHLFKKQMKFVVLAWVVIQLVLALISSLFITHSFDWIDLIERIGACIVGILISTFFTVSILDEVPKQKSTLS